MRLTLGMILAVGAATIMATPSVEARQDTVRYHAYQRSRPLPSYSYDACRSLAIQRGWSEMRLDARGLYAFIDKCMRGGIPWQ